MDYTIIPARKRVIKFCNTKYYLPFPRMLFWLDKRYEYRDEDEETQLKCAFLNSQNQIFFPCLPNIDWLFAVCISGLAWCNLNERINEFWSTSFNADITRGLNYYSTYFKSDNTTYIQDLQQWEELDEFNEANLTNPFGLFNNGEIIVYEPEFESTEQLRIDYS